MSTKPELRYYVVNGHPEGYDDEPRIIRAVSDEAARLLFEKDARREYDISSTTEVYITSTIDCGAHQPRIIR